MDGERGITQFEAGKSYFNCYGQVCEILRTDGSKLTYHNLDTDRYSKLSISYCGDYEAIWLGMKYHTYVELCAK